MEVLKVKDWLESVQFDIELITTDGKILSVIRKKDKKTFDLNWKREFKDADLSWTIKKFMPDLKNVILMEMDGNEGSVFFMQINNI